MSDFKQETYRIRLRNAIKRLYPNLRGEALEARVDEAVGEAKARWVAQKAQDALRADRAKDRFEAEHPEMAKATVVSDEEETADTETEPEEPTPTEDKPAEKKPTRRGRKSKKDKEENQG